MYDDVTLLYEGLFMVKDKHLCARLKQNNNVCAWRLYYEVKLNFWFYGIKVYNNDNGTYIIHSVVQLQIETF